MLRSAPTDVACGLAAEGLGEADVPLALEAFADALPEGSKLRSSLGARGSSKRSRWEALVAEELATATPAKEAKYDDAGDAAEALARLCAPAAADGESLEAVDAAVGRAAAVLARAAPSAVSVDAVTRLRVAAQQFLAAWLCRLQLAARPSERRDRSGPRRAAAKLVGAYGALLVNDAADGAPDVGCLPGLLELAGFAGSGAEVLACVEAFVAGGPRDDVAAVAVAVALIARGDVAKAAAADARAFVAVALAAKTAAAAFPAAAAADLRALDRAVGALGVPAGLVATLEESRDLATPDAVSRWVADAPVAVLVQLAAELEDVA